ncbi:MAG TPA: hypothetical protein VF519_05950 [Mycobacteriales bacterium]|jgi:hypothetical protein
MRKPLALALLVAAAVAAPPHASAMRPFNQVVDPKGDARGNLGFADIVSARWYTTGTGAKRALAATLTLAGAPNTDPGFVYEVGARVDGCGSVEFRYTPLSVESAYRGPKAFFAFCGAPTSPDPASWQEEVTLTVTGRTITWSIPLAVIPESVGLGALYSEFDATADAAEPVLGTPVLGIPSQSIDVGRGDGVWRVR